MLLKNVTESYFDPYDDALYGLAKELFSRTKQRYVSTT